jgi:hypothetical protein
MRRPGCSQLSHPREEEVRRGGGVLLLLYHRDPCFSHKLTAFSVVWGDRSAIYGVGGQLGQGCAVLQRGKRVQA